ncbi:MAG TPA: NADH-quinone oxidoreductase subunit N, partial [Verrucomicrobiae bacterium]|nr:NADH-quinone oxidoreductase subunit N [Verrucomicrobiae bacterium]
MNAQLTIIEIAVILTGLVLLLIDLWIPPSQRRQLGYAAAAVVALVLIGSFGWHPDGPRYAFNNSYVLDPLALYFKRFFLLAAVFVLLMAVDFADRIPVGITEFYALILFALSGMLFAASANDFVMLFVSLELITVTFYILTSYQRSKVKCLEAGVKYLIIGALSTGFTLFGIALIFGTAQTTNFSEILAKGAALNSKLFLLGIFMVLMGLAFKISAFPFQIWAPDVYQGSPTPATAFLAVGSKAAGFVLVLRILFGAVPGVAKHWNELLVVVTCVTILYGNLCAIPQRNLKRLLGYSSIGNAGYLLLGISAVNQAGQSAVLYYLLGYLFTVIAAFFVVSVITRHGEDEDISVLAGLHQRSPLLAATLALAMISLAGIPPLAGFFGKFLLLKSVIETTAAGNFYWVLIGVTLFGIVVSFYYYLGVVRAIYW